MASVRANLSNLLEVLNDSGKKNGAPLLTRLIMFYRFSTLPNTWGSQYTI